METKRDAVFKPITPAELERGHIHSLYEWLCVPLMLPRVADPYGQLWMGVLGLIVRYYEDSADEAERGGDDD